MKVPNPPDSGKEIAKVKGGKHSKPTSYTATAPNQVWTWDITYLHSPVKDLLFYLYLIVDLFSRDIVGHSDNGSPMKVATMLETLYALGIAPSNSRPRVRVASHFMHAGCKEVCSFHSRCITSCLISLILAIFSIPFGAIISHFSLLTVWGLVGGYEKQTIIEKEISYEILGFNRSPTMPKHTK